MIPAPGSKTSATEPAPDTSEGVLLRDAERDAVCVTFIARVRAP